jgi:hypothetical protein
VTDRAELIRRYGCCATCGSWQRTEGGVGECWSGDRIDDFTKGSAGITYAYDMCEAHWDREPIKVPSLPSHPKDHP